MSTVGKTIRGNDTVIPPVTPRSAGKEEQQMFYEGEILMVREGKYKGRKVQVVNPTNFDSSTLYQCKVMGNEEEIALYETDLETMWAHDFRVLKEWRQT